MSAIPVPTEVIRAVEEYVYSELSDAEKYDNSSPLDESGIWSLHRLAACIYQMGFAAGELAESERQHHVHQRDHDRRVKAEKAEEK